MPNMKRIISAINRKKLDDASNIHDSNKTLKCTCHNKEECPFVEDGRCSLDAVIYRANVKILNDIRAPDQRIYHGMTEQKFRERFRAHRKSFNNKKYKDDTELSKFIWQLKEKGKAFEIKWDIIERCSKYRPGMQHCPLCTAEKYHILISDKKTCLNKRSELNSKCRHLRKLKLDTLTPEKMKSHPQPSSSTGRNVNKSPTTYRKCSVVLDDISRNIPRPCTVVLKDIHSSLNPSQNISSQPTQTLRRSTRTRKKRDMGPDYVCY